MELYNADCFDILPKIKANSIDMILCDLPYGTTQNKWDCILPLDKLWEQYKRIIKENGVIALHADMPFTATLVTSCRELYRYELVWVKEKGSDFLNANRKPLKAHETIEIFYKKQPVYNKQWVLGEPYTRTGYKKSENYGKMQSAATNCTDGRRNPTTVLRFKRDIRLHPTQKPLALEEWLIKTYTNPSAVVLDNCMGSGTTGVAAKKTGRDFIGIEKEQKYFQIAYKRIST